MEEMKLRTLLNTDCMELDVATMNTISITLVLQSVAEYEQIFNNSETVHRNWTSYVKIKYVNKLRVECNCVVPCFKINF